MFSQKRSITDFRLGFKYASAFQKNVRNCQNDIEGYSVKTKTLHIDFDLQLLLIYTYWQVHYSII